MPSDTRRAGSGSDDEGASKSRINWQKIGEFEGNTLHAYVPEKNGAPLGRSGVTIGMGVDLGQMDQTSLGALDVSQSLKDKLKPYLGLKGADAQGKLKSAPLALGQDDVHKLNAAVQKTQIEALRRGITIGAFRAHFQGSDNGGWRRRRCAGVRSTVISSTEIGKEGISYLRPTVQALVQPSEIRVPAGDHAEINILNYAKANDLRVIAVGAGRPYCPEYAEALDAAGVLATGPRK